MEFYGMNELPHSYKRYKGLTGYFQKWLINVAKERGLEIANQVEAGAAKCKKTGGSRSNNIPVKDLLPMAEAVAKSGQPLKDISGLADLDGAIRLRKEVTQWYRLQHKSDEGHPFFTSVLTDVRKVFKDWIFVTPTQPEARHNDEGYSGSKNHNPFEEIGVVFGYFNESADMDDSADEPNTDSNVEAKQDLSKADTGPEQRLLSTIAPDANPQVPKSELQIDREFEVLCFLYDLYLLRQRVKSVWSDWSQREIGTMTAAIVSDLAMAHIQQRVASLTQELKDDGNNQDILGIVDKLMGLISEDQRDVALSNEESRLPEYPRDLFCYDGIRTMSEYWSLGAAGVAATHELPWNDSFRLRFLLHFQVVGAGGLEAPAMDKFTESLCSTDARSQIWLPFGFQVLLDIQRLLLVEDRTMGELRDDVLDHGLYIEEIMRQQIDYEDKMCAIGEKPGYMSTADFKFSNTYLPTLMRFLDWRLQLQHDDCEEVSEMRNLSFVAAHPIFCGLTMWFYHRLYHSSAIATICWFMVGLSHLYNACRQVGGLESPWPDLEFVIQSQGSSRIYVGGPPTDPDTFYQRVRLALGNSVREHASDYYRHKNDRFKSVRMQKRGLTMYPLLEDRIVAYYRTKSHEKQSSLLHNIFVFLHKDLQTADVKASSTFPSGETSKTSRVQEKVRIIFRAIAIKRALRAKNKKARKQHKSKVPDFSEDDAVHDKHLEHAASQLAEHELYANFDHFAFFRRAYTIIKRIRMEVLWDQDDALIMLDAAQEAPNDLQLLVGLLDNLAPSHDKKDPVYAATHALGVMKLRKIAKIMQDFIRDQGDVEVKNAEEQVKRRREHGTVPHVKLSFGSAEEAAINANGVGSHDDMLQELEAKPVKNVAPEIPADNDQSRAELPFESYPFKFGQFGTVPPAAPRPFQFCGQPFRFANDHVRFSNPILQKSSEPFRFGKIKHPTFKFGNAGPDRSGANTSAMPWGPTNPFYDFVKKSSSETGNATIGAEVVNPFYELIKKSSSEPGDAAAKTKVVNPFSKFAKETHREAEGADIKIVAKTAPGDASSEPGVSSALDNSAMQPEVVRTQKGLQLKRDEVGMSPQGQGREAYQGQANVAVEGKPSASTIGMLPSTAIQTLADQEDHRGPDAYLHVDEDTKSDKSAEERALERDLAKFFTFGPAMRGRPSSIGENLLAAYYKLQISTSVSESQSDEEDDLLNPPCLSPRAEDFPEHAPGGASLGYSMFGVYHRFTYRSTRSTRSPNYTPSARGYRISVRTRTLSRTRRRLVGAVKHRVCHNCYGRCMVGHALLGPMHDAWWHGADIPEDDGWGTDDDDWQTDVDE